MILEAIRKKLSRKTLIVFICAGLIPLALSYFILYSQGKGMLETNLVDSSSRSVYRCFQELRFVYDKLISLENAIYYDSGFVELVEDPESTLYDRTIKFDDILSRAFLLDMNLASSVQITVVCSDGQIVSSWPKVFADYSFLTEHPVVKRAELEPNHLISNGMQKSFRAGDDSEMLTMSQSFVAGGRTIFTIIIGLDTDYLDGFLTHFLPSENDFILFTDTEGRVLHGVNSELEMKPRAFRSRDNYSYSVVDGDKYLLTEGNFNDYWLSNVSDIYMNCYIAYDAIDSILSNLFVFLLVTLFLVLIGYATVALFHSVHVVKPILALSRRMSSFRLDADQLPIPKSGRTDEIGVMNDSFSDMSEQMRQLFLDLKDASLKKEQYYYDSIRAQIRPHFLFNTLTMIKWMSIMRKENDIAGAIDNLAYILQYTMNKGDEMITLDEELSIIDNYMALQNLRMGGRFTYQTDLDPDTKNMKVIKFILQPIVENAVMHAFGERKEDCRIFIESCIENGCLVIRVCDNGIGMTQESLDEFLRSKIHRREKLSGLGLITVDERIRVQFGDNYGLSVDSGEDGTSVAYLLPCLLGENE